MKLKWAIYLIITLIMIAGVMLSSRIIQNSKAEGDDLNMNTTENKKPVRAPELNGGTGWLNTDKPIYISNLKGKVVLLDFWTYCCINCMHVIPDLKKLEAKYPNELVVIGVHSAKFTNEKDSDNIRQAILRYGIKHTVVNDSEFRIWRSYGVRSWPTLVVINPDGYVSGAVSGEGNYELLDKVISTIIEEYDKDGKIDRTPIRLALEKNKVAESLLSFPGKVITNGLTGKNGRLFISDSNNNRIVVTDLDGNVTEVIGSGDEGNQDDLFDKASFNKPQGMSLVGDQLYIADTENHLIRLADLKDKTVKTIAGTSQQAMGFDNGGKALETPLSSPWDLVAIGNKIYIAMAGPHQIWVMDLKNSYVKPYAGSGREGRLDGKLMESWLAQPSGITTDGKRLYVADSEISSIRAVDLDDNGEVDTIVGLDLFEYGDVDGKGKEVRLQHPLGVLYQDGKLYVADTYNHKIKIIDPEEKTSKTFLGTGNSGNTDGSSPSFYEPSGLAIAGDKLYIADTNNNVIRIADLSTKIVTTLVIKGLDKSPSGMMGLPAKIVVLPSRKVPAGVNGNLVININFPPNYGFTEGAPLDYYIEPCKGIKIEEKYQKATMEKPKSPLMIPISTSDSGECQIKLNLTFNYCDKVKGTCTIEFIRWQIPVEIVKNEGDSRIVIEHKVTPKG
jgi:thiol-disulfide isomerase/thioredoxin